MNTYKFTAYIDCAGCGAEAEQDILKNPEIKSCTFDFMHKQLTVTSDLSRADVLELIKKSNNEVEIKENQHTYSINATVDCPVCANEAECAIKKHSDITSCTFDYINKMINITSPLSREEVIAIIKESSDEVELLDEDKKATSDYAIDATIDCADCARKVEDTLKKSPYVEKVDFDYLHKKLYVTTSLSVDEIKALAKKAEDDILFIDKGEEKEKKEEKIMWARIIISVLLVISSHLFSLPVLAILAYVVAGYDILIKAFKNILKGKAMDENFLMSIATIGALFLGTFEEAAAVMIFYQIGETLQERSVNNSRRSIASLMDIKADITHIVKGGEVEDVPTSTVSLGDTILIKSGEKIPLDGIILKGRSELDYKALNGEAKPVYVEEGNEILSGGINGSGTLEVKATTTYEGSTVKKIIDLMESAKGKKTKSEAFITTFSRYYTPTVCILALLIAILPPLFKFGTFSSYLYKGLTLLVISCPCALVISIPLSYFSSTGAFAKRGILIKNSLVIQNLAKVDTICFDKTGTLTKGEFQIAKIDTKMDKTEVLKIAATLEQGSTHPIGKAITASYQGELYQVADLKELSGIGISGNIDNNVYTLGNSKLLKTRPAVEKEFTTSYLLKDNELIATFFTSDTIKSEAKESIEQLKRLGVKNLIMLSGDKKAVAQKVSSTLGLNGYKAELLPQDKIKEFEKVKKDAAVTAYVGDGINDSPVLAQADVGISMGSIGSDAAIEASDMVLLTDDLARLPFAIKLSRKTQRIVYENIYFSLIIKVLIMLLSILGMGNMWLAIFADVGVSLIATMNAMRTMISKN